MGAWVHRITNIDPVTMTADCRGCGCRVRVKRFGKRYNKTLGTVVQEYQCKARHLQAVYGKLGDNDVSTFIQRADQTCDICGRGYPEASISWDHNHQSGEFRGWLCYECNFGLGQFKDNIELLERAKHYLIERT